MTVYPHHRFLVMKGRLTEAFQHARDSIERNIDVGYFFYILALSADHEEGLRAAKVRFYHFPLCSLH